METRALFGMSLGELTELMAGLGQKAYRARQVWEALYKQRVASLDEVTTLPVLLRENGLDGGGFQQREMGVDCCA